MMIEKENKVQEIEKKIMNLGGAREYRSRRWIEVERNDKYNRVDLCGSERREEGITVRFLWRILTFYLVVFPPLRLQRVFTI